MEFKEILIEEAFEKSTLWKSGERRVLNGLPFCHFMWNLYNPNDKKVIGDGFHIHHKNKNPLDDRIENLEKLTNSEHMKIHSFNTNNVMYGKHHKKESKERISKSKLLYFKENPEAIENLKEKNSSKNHPMYGKHQKVSTIEKRIASHSGEKNHMYGKHHKLESKIKLSNSLKRSKEVRSELSKQLHKTKKEIFKNCEYIIKKLDLDIQIPKYKSKLMDIKKFERKLLDLYDNSKRSLNYV